MIRYISLIMFVFFHFSLLSQIVEGEIISAETAEKLQGAVIILSATDGQDFTVISDVDGRFNIQVGPGEYRLQVQYVGYELWRQNLQIEVNLSQLSLGQLKLTRSEIRMPETVIRGKTAKDPIATVFSKEFFQRIPGAFNDPSRLTVKFPGVSNTNDQNNEIVVRGMAPHLSRWTVNGTPIVNPNHLSNAGTITDQASSSGGGVNMMSGNSISKYELYMNPGTYEYADVAAAVSNTALDLDKGLKLSIGLLGTEVTYAQKGKIDFGANYRYSTLGILSSLGIPLGDEKINFQDLHFNLGFTSNNTRYTINTVVGNSSNIHNPIEEPILYKDFQQIDFTAFQHLTSLNQVIEKGKLRLSNTLNVSGRTGNRNATVDTSLYDVPFIHTKDAYFENIYSARSLVTYRLSREFQWEGVVTPSLRTYETLDDRLRDNSIYLAGGLRYRLPTMEFSIHPALSYLRNQAHLDMKSDITLKKNQHRIKLKYARQAHDIHQEILLVDNDLGSFSSNSLSLDYYINTDKAYFQVGVFGAQFTDVPVSPTNKIGYFHSIELIKQNALHSSLVNEGTALQYALQSQFQYLLYNKLQIILGASIHRVYFPDRDIISTYNFLYNAAATVSYTKSFGESRLIVGLSLQSRGASNELLIDLEESNANNSTIYDLNSDSSREGGAFFRTDVKVDYIFGTNGRSRISMDIQNATNQKNHAYFYYEPLQDDIQQQRQLGIIPILRYTRTIL